MIYSNLIITLSDELCLKMLIPIGLSLLGAFGIFYAAGKELKKYEETLAAKEY